MMPFAILAIEDSDDRDFMESIYNDYKRLMYSEINKITRDRWVTEDILHSVIVKLIDKVSLLRSLTKAKLINYIMITSKNTALNYLRDTKKVSEYTYDENIYDNGVQDSLLEDKLISIELINSMHSAWRLLDERSKRVLEMKYILEKKDSEIAEELGIGANSVRMTLTRARNNFKRELNNRNDRDL